MEQFVVSARKYRPQTFKDVVGQKVITNTLLNAIDRFTINDNSEPTIIDSVHPNGPSWIFVDEGMHQRHQLIKNIFNVS